MKELINKTLADYINDVDSSLPAPGGGSVMGLVGSLGCALAGMVGHLTVNKKKFLELEKEHQDNFKNAIEKIKEIKSYLADIIDKDAESFNLFMEAMKMPKETDTEKENRKKAMSEASKKAIEIPFNALKYCYELMPLFDTVTKYANSAVISDIAAAYILIYACAKGSVLNININIPMIDDNVFLEHIKTDTKKYMNEIDNIYTKTSKVISLFNV